jgi:hypothetical protein
MLMAVAHTRGVSVIKINLINAALAVVVAAGTPAGTAHAASPSPTPQGSAKASPSWTLQNSAKSYTGAILHPAVNDQVYGNAVIIEPGGPERKISMTVDTDQDWPYGIKVWHPGTCTKVYERILLVWVRVEKYEGGAARDVWVTKSLGSAGEKFRVKIVRDC